MVSLSFHQVSLTDEEFTTTWNQISVILTRLGGASCPPLIKRIEQEMLDSEAQVFYIESLANSLQEQITPALHPKEPKSYAQSRWVKFE